VEIDSSVAFIDIHILSNEVETVVSINGHCYWIDDTGARVASVRLGESINKDDLIYAEAGAELRFSRGMIRGGNRGRTHSFVDPESLQLHPGQEEVTQLLDKLRMLGPSADENLAREYQLQTTYDQVYAADYAMNNLEPLVARSLPERTSRQLDAICLFSIGASMCVAFSEVSSRRLIEMITRLGRPVKPHLVDRRTLETLFSMAYGA